jgi:TPR repeat protein
MRISDTIAMMIAGLALVGPAVAFDGKSDGVAPAVNVDVLPATPGVGFAGAGTAPAGIVHAPVAGAATPMSAPANLSPLEAFRNGAEALRAGETEKGIVALQYAASKGHPIAQWKLGRMYAEGDGVDKSDLRAFEYFRGIADAHAEDSPGTPQSRFVANAFVSLGNYYLTGIADSTVKKDPRRAREMFNYAAVYFQDPDAQYNLGRLYADGVGTPKDAKLAARWFGVAAKKGQHQAQAMLGAMLFKGDNVPRQGARGLALLTLASEAATAQEGWIKDLQSAASAQATDDEKALAVIYLERWVRGDRD